MIRYFKHKDIDKEKWDQCIGSSFNGNIYAYPWYLDIVAPEWEALVEDDYERVMPLVVRKKYGVSYVYQPYFAQQLGIFSRNILTPYKVHEFLAAIPKKFRLVEMNLNVLNKVESDGFKVYPQVNHELDLIQSYDALYKNYSTNARRNLKKAKESGSSIMKDIKPSGIISLFRENRGNDIPNLKDFDYQRLSRLIYTGIHRGLTQIYGVYTEYNELCAGAVFITGNKKSVFIFSGLNQEGRERRAMFLIIDHFIKENSNSHLVLDFDGSNNPDLARFYKGFGSKECSYLRIRRDNLPFPVRLLKKMKS